MKNNRAKRRAFEWKHLMNNYGRLPYMAKISKWNNMINRQKFNIIHFRKTVLIMEHKADNGCGFPTKRGERAWSQVKDVCYSWGSMTFVPALGSGVTRNINKTH